MPEEKRPDVVNHQNIPTTGLGILVYMGSRVKRDASQLINGVRNILNPVFTPDTDEEALLEDDELSESEYYKTSSTLAAPSNNVFNAEDEETLKKAKIHVEKHLALLHEELPPLEAVNIPIAQKAHDANMPPIQLDLDSMNDKIQSLLQEGNDEATTKAALLAKIIKQVSALQTSNSKDTLLQAIATIRKSIIDNQTELSRYRSKWGSGFFFGTILRMDLMKRVTSKTRIDNLTEQLDNIGKSVWGMRRV